MDLWWSTEEENDNSDEEQETEEEEEGTIHEEEERRKDLGREIKEQQICETRLRNNTTRPEPDEESD